MEIKLKALNENGVKGFEKMKAHSKGLILKRIIQTIWLTEDHSQIMIMNAPGVTIKDDEKSKSEMLDRLSVYFSTVCKLKPTDYEVFE